MSQSPAQGAAAAAKTPAQKKMAAELLVLEAKGDKICFYVCHDGKKIARPCLLRRKDDYFAYVTILSGRRRRAVSIVNSEFYSYWPGNSYRLAT